MQKEVIIMKLTMLGTGNAIVTECYNTCFIFDDNDKYFMVDGGGGNQILHQLKHAGFNWKEIRHIFVTHKHLDHLTGIIWMVRMICQSMEHNQYIGEAYIYGHDEVISIINNISHLVLTPYQTKFINNKLHLVIVNDGEKHIINDRAITFFDIHSTKAKQFGFSMQLNNGKLTCCGDEPRNPSIKHYVENSTWLLHEAFCLYSQRNIYKPYEKHHSTVKDACELAQSLHIKNLILYHSEDDNIADRKKLYTNEGKKYYDGHLFIPDDLEVINIK